ncbi:MAG: AAA family ATPase [Anaerolineales bacterium]
MDLKLWVLGPPRIEIGGKPLRVDTRKATALLVYLAERGEPQRRESLATLFWPESDTSHSKAALRRTLSALRKAVGGDWVSADRDAVTLSAPWLDTQEFRTLLAGTRKHGHAPTEVCDQCLEPLIQAVQLYRDGFLSGFTLPDSPEFDEWQYFTAQSLQRQHADALQRLVQVHEREGNYELATEFSLKSLALDPLNESAHRELMALYARLGRRGMAMQQYRDCVRVLQDELGAPPLEETVELYETIKTGELVAVEPRTSPTPVVKSALARLPLVGRQDQMAELRASYSQIEGSSNLILIEGEAGIGKTRLAEEFLEGSSAVVLTARCYLDESSVAFRPWIDALRSAIVAENAGAKLEELPEIWLTEAARLLPEIPDLFSKVKQPTSDLGDRGQDRYLNGLVQVLGALVKGDEPGIVFLDDLQWADEASLDLIAYMMRRGPDPPLLVVATWRVESAVDDQRLRTWIASLPTELVSAISLPLLTEQDVAKVVGTLKSSAPASRLYEETEGLPLFLAEYLAALEVGTIVAEDGEWSLPTQVQEILRSRLASVTGASQQLLGAAAVIGRSFEFEILRTVSGRSPEETVSGLEMLIAGGFVREYREQQPPLGPAYDFKHDKFRELALTDTTQARQRLLHARAAEALSHMQGSSSGGALASRIARHFEISGNESRAAEYYNEAGDHARGLYANDEAIAHYQSALALGYEEPGLLHEVIADLKTLIGNYDVAAQEYEAAAAYQAHGRIARIEHKLGGLYERWGKRERALSYYEAAAGSSSDEGSRARVYADWSLTEHREGHDERSRELIDLALKDARSAEDPRALAQCHNMLGILARAEGDGEAAERYLSQSLEFAEQLDDPAARAAALNNLALAMASDGNREAAIELEREALQISEALGDRHRSAAIHSNLADILHNVGDEQAANEHLTQSAALFAEVGVVSGSYEPEIWKLVDW